MSNVLNFTLPGGYRVASADFHSVVECERGCGWKMRVATFHDTDRAPIARVDEAFDETLHEAAPEKPEPRTR